MIQRLISTVCALLSLAACTRTYDVVVVGGGTGGTAAAIEAARGGARVLIVEESPWLGGMLTSAGVSAIDGNYRLRGGIFGEFTDSLAARYGGYEALKSGWVSNILFNPATGAEILAHMADEAGVEVRFGTRLEKLDGHWRLTLSDGSRVKARILMDGTELGDVALAAGARTFKMKCGHHGGNHPVKELATGRVSITGQNHSFAVDVQSLPRSVRTTHVSLFDGTVQGLEWADKPAHSFQGQPKGSPGLRDMDDFFDRFVKNMAAAQAA